MAHQRIRAPGHAEQGFADVIAEHDHKVYAAQKAESPSWFFTWEEKRPRWLMEMIAEFCGVFIYVYAGIGAGASFYLTTVSKQAGYGGLLNVGLAYGLAIALGLIVAAPTSGGHLSPAYTLCFAFYKGFPWRKVPRYIVAQLLGGMCACFFVYAQYKQQFDAVTNTITAEAGPLAKKMIFSADGPAGVFSTYPTEGQNLGYVFLNELMVNVVLSVIVWSILDTSNFFVTLAAAPILVGAAYMMIIWGFAVDTIVLNTARDLGGRFVAAAIWGHQAFPHRYSALSALTNIVGTFIGASIQTFFLMDKERPVHNPIPEGHPLEMEQKRQASRVSAQGDEKTLV